ncbi:MAG TPA: FkbM family methyltransferase, partial [Ramlibacter sp.]|nr:FkbM family methyltransferase [Ramlibacter sp.]
GAHIGAMIAQVARQCPDARIEAFEPIPEKVDRLRDKFPAVVVHQCALSDSQGTATFYVDLEQSAYSSLARNSPQAKEIQVAVRTLDSMTDATDVDVVKIDVEGAELGVLRGATALLTRCRPVVMFESGPNELLGYGKVDLWQFFHERQYGIYVPNRMAHTAAPMTCDCFLDSHAYPRRTTNYFAVPGERFQEVRARTRRILKLHDA